MDLPRELLLELFDHLPCDSIARMCVILNIDYPKQHLQKMFDLIGEYKDELEISDTISKLIEKKSNLQLNSFHREIDKVTQALRERIQQDARLFQSLSAMLPRPPAKRVKSWSPVWSITRPS